jgi:hypothetical protein
VPENRVLRRIFRAKREEMSGGWRRLHNEESHNLYASTKIISMMKSRTMRWAGHVAHVGEMKIVYKILVGKPKGKRLLRLRRAWKDNIRMDLREIGWKDCDWIHLYQNRDQWRAVVNMVMKLWVPQNAGIP